MDNLSLQALNEFPLIQPGDNLSSIILESCKHNQFKLQDGDIIAIAQKVVSKSEGRYENLLEIKPSQKAFDLGKSLNREPAFIELILNESNEIISTEKNVIIVEHKLGFININAGIDRSNIPENKNLVLLLPEDPSGVVKKKNMGKTNQTYDVIILGGGAGGMFAAIVAAKKGKKVLVLEKSNKVGKKILMSGGGRCNFTNQFTAPKNFLSKNSHFCKSALSQYTAEDFINMVQSHDIDYETRKHG